MRETRSRSRIWSLLIVGGVVIAGAAWAVTTSAADPNVALVKALAVDTLTLEHRMGVPELASQGVSTVADAASLRDSANASANAHYRGPLLATRTEQMLAAVNDRINGTSSLIDGGAKDIEFLDTTVSATSARVRLKATTWATYSQNGVTAHPSSTDTWTFDFEKDGSQWYVVNVDSDFHG